MSEPTEFGQIWFNLLLQPTKDLVRFINLDLFSRVQGPKNVSFWLLNELMESGQTDYSIIIDYMLVTLALLSRSQAAENSILGK